MTSAFVFTTKNNKVLLVKHSYGNKKWHLPGGSLEANEGPKNAAIREFYEETGGILKSIESIGKIYTQGLGFSYIFKGSAEGYYYREPNKEISKIGFFDPKSLPKSISKFAKERIEFAIKNKFISNAIKISKYSEDLNFIDAKKIINELIEDAIEELIKNEDVFYIRRLHKLKQKLLAEIIQNKLTPKIKSYNLYWKNLLSQYDNSNFKIGNFKFTLFTFLSPKNIFKSEVINLLFPCKNSINTIDKSVEYLMHEVRGTKELSFNICFIESNSTDKTLQRILEKCSSINIPINCKIYVLSAGKKQINNSESIISGIKFIDSIIGKNPKIEYYFSSWDDEINSRIKLDHNIFESNLNLLKRSNLNKAVSCYMIDNRKKGSTFLSIHNNPYVNMDKLTLRPMVHNGGAIVVRWEDMLKVVINKNQIPGISFSGALLLLNPYNKLKNLDLKTWPLKINPKSPIFHPAEEDILQWTIKYLGYFMSWEKSIGYVRSKNSRTADLWFSMLNKNRTERDRIFYRRIKKLTEFDNNFRYNIIGKKFMHSYYKTIFALTCKKNIYDALKIFRKE